MTTFANSFDQSTTMQAPADAMEVHSDLKNVMAMEEDQLDIDLELGDEPHPNADEDSMMDDDAGDGRNQVDADQQMDDDFQENKDQDDEILDYVDENAPVLEVPMAEDVPQQTTNLPTSQLENLFPAAVPNVEAMQSVDSTQSQKTVEENSVSQIALDASPQDPPNISKPVVEIPDTYENVESIRTLYDAKDEASTTLQGSGESTSEILKSEEPQSQVQTSEEEYTEDTNQPAEKEEVKSEKAEARDKGIATAASLAPPSTTTGEAENAGDTGSNPLQELNTQDHDEAKLRDEGASAEHADQLDLKETASDPHQTQEMTTDPIGIIVTCQGHQMSLFPPYEEHGTPETYLLPDDTLAGKPIRALLDTCSGILSGSLSEFEELELHVPSFKLAFREHATEASHYSIRDMSDLHFQLHQNDGVEQPQPLHVILNVRTRLSGHIDHLYTLAAEGKGLQFFEESKVTALPVYSEVFTGPDQVLSQNDHDSDEGSPGELAAEEEDEFGEPDLPQDEAHFEDLEYHQGTEDDHPDQNAGAESTQEPEVKPDTDPDNTHDVAVEANAAPDHVEPLVENTEAENGDFTNQHEPVDLEHLHEDNAESYEFDLKEDPERSHDQETENDHADANYDSFEAGDAQRRTFDANVETSQSLHSATQPEDAAREAQSPSKVADSIPVQAKPNDTTVDDGVTREEIPSSPTVKGQESSTEDALVRHEQGEEGEDLFEEDDYEQFGDLEPVEEEGQYENIDLAIEDNPATTPQSLKRSRAVADEVGEDDDDDDDGHQLKKTR